MCQIRCSPTLTPFPYKVGKVPRPRRSRGSGIEVGRVAVILYPARRSLKIALPCAATFPYRSSFIVSSALRLFVSSILRIFASAFIHLSSLISLWKPLSSPRRPRTASHLPPPMFFPQSITPVTPSPIPMGEESKKGVHFSPHPWTPFLHTVGKGPGIGVGKPAPKLSPENLNPV